MVNAAAAPAALPMNCLRVHFEFSVFMRILSSKNPNLPLNQPRHFDAARASPPDDRHYHTTIDERQPEY